MAIKKKIRIPRGTAQAQAREIAAAALSTTAKGGFLREDLELYVCSGPPDLRSLSHNAYYWGVVVKTVSDYTGDHPQDVHRWYKARFAITFHTFNGVEFEDSRSTSEMNKKQFAEYVEMIRLHALEVMGLDIPLPGDVPDHVYVEHINAGLA